MKLNYLNELSVDELREIIADCQKAIDNLERKDYEEKIINFKDALYDLVEYYPYKICMDTGEESYTWNEVKNWFLI